VDALTENGSGICCQHSCRAPSPTVWFTRIREATNNAIECDCVIEPIGYLNLNNNKPWQFFCHHVFL